MSFVYILYSDYVIEHKESHPTAGRIGIYLRNFYFSAFKIPIALS